VIIKLKSKKKNNLHQQQHALLLETVAATSYLNLKYDEHSKDHLNQDSQHHHHAIVAFLLQQAYCCFNVAGHDPTNSEFFMGISLLPCYSHLSTFSRDECPIQ
jgi:hypothetical protein